MGFKDTGYFKFLSKLGGFFVAIICIVAALVIFWFTMLGPELQKLHDEIEEANERAEKAEKKAANASEHMKNMENHHKEQMMHMVEQVKKTHPQNGRHNTKENMAAHADAGSMEHTLGQILHGV